MTLPLEDQARRSAFAPLSIRDLLAMVERLPASVRAELAWAPMALRKELQPLIDGSLDAANVENAAGSVFEIQARVLPAIAHGLGDLTGRLDDAYDAELGRLTKILPDAGSKRSAEWVVRVLRAVGQVMVQHRGELDQIDLGEATRLVTAQLAQHEAGWFFSGMVLLMAAMVIADEGGDVERAAELSDLAFLNTSRAIDYLARAGLGIDLEAIDRKDGRQIVEVFEEARASLAGEDIDSLSRIRLRDLR